MKRSGRLMMAANVVTLANVTFALITGLLFGFLCSLILSRTQNGSGDFAWALRAGRDLVSGRDPYAYPTGPYNIPYPLPAAFFALPVTWLEDTVAAGVFFGASCSLLTWLILSRGARWQLLILLSWPFVYSLIYAQWSPLILCLYFMPAFSMLVLVKPQIALPLALTKIPDRWAIGLTAIVGVISLLIYPSWPIVWFRGISAYQGILPPLLVLPLGPLMFLALFRYRERRAWILFLMAAMPQRVLYDQLALLLVAKNRREILVLLLFSWATFPALLIFHGWTKLPGGWQLWIQLTLYLPALVVLLAPPITSRLRATITKAPQVNSSGE